MRRESRKESTNREAFQPGNGNSEDDEVESVVGNEDEGIG